MVSYSFKRLYVLIYIYGVIKVYVIDEMFEYISLLTHTHTQALKDFRQVNVHQIKFILNNVKIFNI